VIIELIVLQVTLFAGYALTVSQLFERDSLFARLPHSTMPRSYFVGWEVINITPL